MGTNFCHDSPPHILVLLSRNRVVEDMQNLDRMKDEFADVQIPIAVLR